MKTHKGMVGMGGKAAAAAMGHTPKEHAAMMAKPKKAMRAKHVKSKVPQRGKPDPLKAFGRY